MSIYYLFGINSLFYLQSEMPDWAGHTGKTMEWEGDLFKENKDAVIRDFLNEKDFFFTKKGKKIIISKEKREDFKLIEEIQFVLV